MQVWVKKIVDILYLVFLHDDSFFFSAQIITMSLPGKCDNLSNFLSVFVLCWLLLKASMILKSIAVYALFFFYVKKVLNLTWFPILHVITFSNARDRLEGQLSVAPKLGQLISAGSGKSIDPPSNANETGSSASHGACQHGEAKTTALLSRTQDFDNNYRAHSKTPPSNSSDSLYSSFSDPVHVPSANSLSAGKVGAIRREVGAVGAQRQPPNYGASQSSVSTNSFSISLLRKEVSPQTELPGHSIPAYKSNQLNQVSTPVPTVLNTPMGKSAPSNQHNGKVHRQSVGSHKGKSSVTSILNVVLVSWLDACMMLNICILIHQVIRKIAAVYAIDKSSLHPYIPQHNH